MYVCVWERGELKKRQIWWQNGYCKIGRKLMFDWKKSRKGNGDSMSYFEKIAKWKNGKRKQVNKGKGKNWHE